MSRFGIPRDRISVLYDRAVGGKFKVLTMRQKHEFFNKINMDNMITVPGREDIEYRDDRPLLLLTSTSYTPDEDLDILLEALKAYVQKAMASTLLP